MNAMGYSPYSQQQTPFPVGNEFETQQQGFPSQPVPGKRTVLSQQFLEVVSFHGWYLR